VNDTEKLIVSEEKRRKESEERTTESVRLLYIVNSVPILSLFLPSLLYSSPPVAISGPLQTSLPVEKGSLKRTRYSVQ
jgi:hypothetical protein